MLNIRIVHFKKFKNIKIFINNINVLTAFYNLSYINKSTFSAATVVLPYLSIFSRCGWNISLKKYHYVSFSR